MESAACEVGRRLRLRLRLHLVCPDHLPLPPPLYPVLKFKIILLNIKRVNGFGNSRPEPHF